MNRVERVIWASRSTSKILREWRHLGSNFLSLDQSFMLDQQQDNNPEISHIPCSI